MAEIGDRVSIAANKVGQVPREGVVRAKTGNLIRIEWESGEESTIMPAPGTLTVLRKGRGAAKQAAGKGAAAKKTAAGKGAAAKKAASGKVTAKKAAPARKAAAPAKKTAAKKAPTPAKKAAPAKKAGGPRR